MILMDSAQFPGIPLEVYFFLKVFIEIFKFKISQYKKIDKKTNLFIWN